MKYVTLDDPECLPRKRYVMKRSFDKMPTIMQTARMAFGMAFEMAFGMAFE